MSKHETVEEFLARGGQLIKCEQGSAQTSTASQLIKKDRKLRALKVLLKEVEDKEGELYARVQNAIDEQYQILKACN